jgi:hypothetical protein
VNRDMNTIIAITALVVALALVATFTIAIPALQAVLAKGPPEKAQAILAAEPKDRGAVASGGQGGGGTCGSCGT